MVLPTYSKQRELRLSDNQLSVAPEVIGSLASLRVTTYVLLTAGYLLLAAHRSPLTVHAHCSLLTCRLLLTAYWYLRAICCLLLATCYLLLTADSLLLTAYC